jgi:hypothetical protein
LFNGTRLEVKEPKENSIDAGIITASNKGENAFIYRMNVKPI